jgi:rhodanese-related sulfurtransferase
MPRFRDRPVDAVIDVRSKIEFWMGHLPGAVCVPVDQVAQALAAMPGVSTRSRILVYCASGGRSAAAAVALRGAGYHQVTDGGGIGMAKRDYVAD